MSFILSNSLTRYSRPLILFCVAFGLRLGLYFIIQPWQKDVQTNKLIISDARGYHRIAINLLENNGFSTDSQPPYFPNLVRTPVYPLFLTLFYFLFGIKAYIAILFQLIIGSASCVLTYQIGKMIFDRQIAWVAGWMMALEHSHIFYSNLLLTETLFTFLFLLHVRSLLKFLFHYRYFDLFFSGLFLGLSTLCRPVAVYFIVFIAVLLFIQFRKDVRRQLWSNGLMIIVFLGILSPWLIRNYTISGKWMVSSMQEIAVSWYIDPIYERLESQEQKTPDPNGVLPLDESTESSSVENENQTNLFHVLAIESVKYMIRVVLFFVIPSGNVYYISLLNMEYHHWDRGDFTSKPLTLLKTAFREIHFTQWLVISLSFVWTMFLNTAMVMGIYSSIKRKELRIVTVFLVVIVYFAMATGAAFGARFRVPILPYLILLSSYGLVHRFRLLKNRAGNNKE